MSEVPMKNTIRGLDNSNTSFEKWHFFKIIAKLENIEKESEKTID